jgi:hypothetical protein
MACLSGFDTERVVGESLSIVTFFEVRVSCPAYRHFDDASQ